MKNKSVEKTSEVSRRDFMKTSAAGASSLPHRPKGR
ncbi:MAG: twin-arginine translocation signal domain-containing protein [Planctomycetota bacterium]